MPEKPPILKIEFKITRVDGWAATKESPQLLGIQPSTLVRGGAAPNSPGQSLPVSAVPVAIKPTTEDLITQLEEVINELKEQLQTYK